MQETQTTRMPTGITSLDPILDGGIPPGTMILLLGEIGAGNYEFAYSSTVNSMECMNRPRDAGTVCPAKIVYITFTRLEADVRHEIVQSFHADGVTEGMAAIRFEDLSDLYFDRSIVPDSWYSHSNTLTRLQKRSEHANIFMRLAEIFDAAEPGSMIILDSITDIAHPDGPSEPLGGPDRFSPGASKALKDKKTHHLPAAQQGYHRAGTGERTLRYCRRGLFVPVGGELRLAAPARDVL